MSGENELPQGWAVGRLGGLGNWYGGGTPAKGNSEYWTDGTVPWVSPKDMKSDRIDDATDHITELAVVESSTKLVPAGSILVVTRSGILQRTLPVALATGEVAINQDMKAIHPKQGVDGFYLSKFLVSRTGDILRKCRKSGTTVASIETSRLHDYEVPLAPSNEQRRIVAKIDALQGRSRRAREALGTIPALLERFRQSVLAAAFRGDLTEDWRALNPDVEPASVLLERIRVERKTRWIEAAAEKARVRAQARAEKKGKPWTAEDDEKVLARETGKAEKKYMAPEPVDPEKEGLPELPEGWCWTTTEMVGEILNGRQRAKPRPGKESRPYLRIANIQDDRIDFNDVNEMDHSPEAAVKYRLLPGDILVSAGQSLTKVGQSAMYREGMPEVGFQKNLFRFRASPFLPSPAFAQLVFRAWVRTGMFLRRSSITTNLAYMTTTKFAECPFPLPPREEQLSIVRIATRLLADAGAQEARASSCTEGLFTLDQAILAKAFRGELVPQDPNDEPAIVLLGRINVEREAAKNAPRGRGRCKRNR